MRTNLIQALQFYEKPFWMLQADTIWASNPLPSLEKLNHFDILVDQQGYEGVAESRKNIMNGANFYVPVGETSKALVHSWINWQRWIYITDPDIVKMFCLSGQFSCGYIPHNLISGWEWIYGDQTNAPMLIQMDGETDGGKERVLAKYGFWFLNKKLECKRDQVRKAITHIREGTVPQVYSASKAKQNTVLKIGEWLNQMPIFGYYSSIYGGITSLYLQLFNFSLQ
ncbi:unnamed protein product [Auanema sp. JU1783]|nr:unnamed protein product [Auanema sp. JU1783]